MRFWLILLSCLLNIVVFYMTRDPLSLVLAICMYILSMYYKGVEDLEAAVKKELSDDDLE